MLVIDLIEYEWRSFVWAMSDLRWALFDQTYSDWQVHLSVISVILAMGEYL